MSAQSTPKMSPRAGSGGYLVYKQDQNGQLFLKWSETEVEGALAFFQPTKKVPKFKFTTNEGRTMLCHGANDKAKFYAGWGAFLKEGLKNFQADHIKLYTKGDNEGVINDVQLILLLQGNAVETYGPDKEKGMEWEGESSSILSFAVQPKDSTMYDVGTMEPRLFIQKANTAPYFGAELC